jgi:hypothetical protein
VANGSFRITSGFSGRVSNIGVFSPTDDQRLADATNSYPLRGIVAIDSGKTAPCTFNSVGMDCTSSTTTVVTGDTANAVVGKANSDATNLTDASGTATYNRTSMDWIHFDSRYRAWGRDNAATWPDALYRGRCSANAQTCRIMDWRIKSTSTIRNVVPLPPAAGTYTHSYDVLASPSRICRNAFPGAQGPDGGNNGLCTVTVFPGARERLHDGEGNDNGLCELGETCVITSNLGAYQGEGQLLDGGVVQTDAGVIHLLQYETNGVP